MSQRSRTFSRLTWVVLRTHATPKRARSRLLYLLAVWAVAVYLGRVLTHQHAPIVAVHTRNAGDATPSIRASASTSILCKMLDADAAAIHIEPENVMPQIQLDQGSAGPKVMLALVGRLQTGKLRPSTCDRASAATKLLHISQSVFKIAFPSTFDVAILVPGARDLSCPGVVSLSMSIERAIYDFVVFVDIDTLLAQGGVRLHATVLEKMILAASAHPHATMVSIHPSMPQKQNTQHVGGVCLDASSPYVRRKACHFTGSPLLMRVPVWLGAIGQLNWIKALKEVFDPPNLHDLLSSNGSFDILSPLFCSAIVGSMRHRIHSLHELEHLVSHGENMSTESNVTCEGMLASRPNIQDAWSRVATPFAVRPTSAYHYSLSHGPTVSDDLGRPGFMLIVPWLEHGGADQFNANIARRLTMLGVRVIVVTTLKSSHPTAREFYAITPHVFHLDQFVPSLIDQAAAIALITHLTTTRNVEVAMISHSAYAYSLLPLLRANVRMRHVKFVDFVHLEEPEWGAGGYAAISMANKKHLDHTFAASVHVAEWMRKRGQYLGHPPIDRTSVAYIGVDTGALRPLDDTDRLRERTFAFPGHARYHRKPVIAYLARMVDQKLPHVYFEIIRRLRVERKLDFLSVAIGDGERLGELRANISHQPLLRHNVLTYGMLDHESSMRILSASDIVLLPSRNEGISLAVYEAMALGVVPVVSAVGGQCELVSGGAGACIMFDADGAAAAPDFARMYEAITPFVDELERLITSAELLAKSRHAARATVESRFSLDRTIKSLRSGIC